MAEKRDLTKKQRRLKRKRRRRRIIFSLEIVVLLLMVGGLFIFAKMGKMEFAELNFKTIDINTGIRENETLKGYTTLGLVGIDRRKEYKQSLQEGLSDTMIIASINNDTKKVKLVSVYRDTYLRTGVDKEGNGVYEKANEAYAKGGPEKFVSMLNTNLDLNISDVVTVDFSAVAEVSELLGGIDEELTVEEIKHLNNYCVETSKETGMSYENLPEVAGVYHLNGVQTVAYARIRYTVGNDMRRAARQREVIYKLVDKAKKTDILTLNKIVDKVFPMVYTSLTKTEILSMGMNMLSYEIEDQAGYPFDHLMGENVKNAVGMDVVIPVTLESNAVKLHEFLYPGGSYTPSAELQKYSQWIVDKSGYGDESRLAHSEDGNLEAYREWSANLNQ